VGVPHHDPCNVEEGLKTIATEGDEMALSGFVGSIQIARHGESLHLAARQVCDVPTLGQKMAERGHRSEF